MFRRYDEVTEKLEYSKDIIKPGRYDLSIDLLDCNNKQIYQNDVLVYETAKEIIYGRVEYKNEPIINANDGMIYCLKDFGNDKIPFEVIGSIHFTNKGYDVSSVLNYRKLKLLTTLLKDMDTKRKNHIKENLQNESLNNLIKDLQEIITIINTIKDCKDMKAREILTNYCNEKLEKLQPKG